MKDNYGMPTRGAGTATKKPKMQKFTGQDQGGPLEQKAHLEETQFWVIVRDDERGGYWITDPSNNSRITGSRRNANGPPRPPVKHQMLLRSADDVRYAVESIDKNLDVIYRERDLIRYMRICGYDEPISAATERLNAELEVWDKAIELDMKPWDYLDAELNEIDPRVVAKERVYKLKPIREMANLVPTGKKKK